MSHQDWDYITLTKTNKAKANEKKPQSTLTKQQKALLNEEEVPKIKYVDREFSKEITQARLAKGLTRKEVANQMCLIESVIASWENGTAVHNGPMVSRFKTFYGLNKK